jgi:type III restriction enzyme
MQLPLVKSLAPRLQAECAGLESGSAPILEKVMPVTADLLRWWFQQDCCDARAVNFHEGQRQAILNTIYAHEILQPANLKELYEATAEQSSEVLPKDGDRHGQDVGFAGVALLAIAQCGALAG